MHTQPNKTIRSGCLKSGYVLCRHRSHTIMLISLKGDDNWQDWKPYNISLLLLKSHGIFVQLMFIFMEFVFLWDWILPGFFFFTKSGIPKIAAPMAMEWPWRTWLKLEWVARNADILSHLGSRFLTVSSASRSHMVVFYIRASYWLPSLSFLDNRASHSRDTIWPWQSKVKGKGQKYPSQRSVLLTHFLGVSHQGILSTPVPFVAWQSIWLQLTHFLFVSHQLDQPFLRYGKYNVGLQKTNLKFYAKNRLKFFFSRISPKFNQVESMIRGIYLQSDWTSSSHFIVGIR